VNMDVAKNEITMKDFVTLLGPKEIWGSSFKEAVEYCLGSSNSVGIYYGDGDDFIFMYNQTSAFGKAFKESLPGTYLHMKSEYGLILKGETLFRHNYLYEDLIIEDKHYEDGTINAMLCVCEDTTETVLGIEKRIINTPNNLTRNNGEESRKRPSELKRLIKELTAENPRITEIWEEESENSENLLHLYNKITNAEIRKEIANREVIKSYYLFGKVLIQRFKYYSDKSFNVHQAQMAVNEELEKQLPGTTKNARNKRKERAQKIYSFFNDIGVEKIELVKSFSADSISRLSIKKIKYIKDEIMKTAQQNT
ncbi:6202_t:CDS:2, partial [Scutellospora calospora]